jgi:hypothetical protein
MARLRLTRNAHGRWKWTFWFDGDQSATGQIRVPASTKETERSLVLERLSQLSEAFAAAFKKADDD